MIGNSRRHILKASKCQMFSSGLSLDFICPDFIKETYLNPVSLHPVVEIDVAIGDTWSSVTHPQECAFVLGIEVTTPGLGRSCYPILLLS